jgi:hypothetical protein
MRWTFDAKQATSTRPWQLGMIADESLRAGEARAFRIGGVAEQEIDAEAAKLGQPSDVGPDAVHRRVIELPVAGREDTSGGALEQDGHGVWNGVRDPHELHAEGPNVDRPGLWPRFYEVGRLQQPVLVEARLGESEGQTSAPHLGNANLAQQIRESADVILVGVREDHGADAVPPVGQIGEVREDQVDAEVLVAREREPGVENDDVFAKLEGGHVLADLPDTAQRDDAQGLRSHDCTLIGAATRP